MRGVVSLFGAVWLFEKTKIGAFEPDLNNRTVILILYSEKIAAGQRVCLTNNLSYGTSKQVVYVQQRISV